MPAISDDQVLINKQQSSSTTITSTTDASTDSSSQDIKPPSPAEAPAAGRKLALLCGVTCRGAGENISCLEGPVNDVKEIKKMLINHFGYTEECIRVLTEEENGNELTTPTKENIKDSLKWLVEGSKSGDSLVFFFSGHCVQCVVRHDEVRVPHDHSENNTLIINSTRSTETSHNHVCLVDCTGKGKIPNSYINSTIVRPLKEGVTLYAIVDACHSGSILDLNYEYEQQSNDKGRWMDLSKAEKGTSGGLAICLSACKDNETAPETNANYSSEKGTAETMGAMTYHLIQNIVTSNVTYEYILKKMHVAIKSEPLGTISTGRSLLSDYRECQKIKEPVLSSSLEFQVSSKKFLL